MANNGSNASYQPASGGGILGFLSRLFVTTPTYAGEGQPSPRTGGLLGSLLGGQPVYKVPPAPVSTETEQVSKTVPVECNPFPSIESISGDKPDSQSSTVTIVIARD